MKEKKYYLSILIVGIFTLIIGANIVNAADTMFSLKGKGYLYTEAGGYNGNTVSSCSGYGNCTYYKKLCSNSSVSSESTCNDGIEAYCVQKHKESPGTGLTYTEVPIGSSYSGLSWTQDNALKAGYIMNAINNTSSYSAEQKYIYNYMALNIFTNSKGLAQSYNYSNTTAKSFVTEANKQKFCTANKYSSSPITISNDSDKFFSYNEDSKGNGYYYAKVILSLNNANGCGDSISYTISVDKGNIYENSNLAESSKVGKTVTISKKTSYTFYIKVSASDISAGSKVKYTIDASSTSTYKIAKLWKPSNTSKQAVMTLSSKSFKQTANKSSNITIPAPDKMNVSVKKIDESGSSLAGAEIDVTVYGDSDGKDVKGNCSISSKTSNDTGCSITFEEPSDSETYTYYWNYTEKSAPTGYALIQSPGIQSFTLGKASTSYFYTYIDSKTGEPQASVKTDAAHYNATYVSLNDGVCVSQNKVVASGVAESNCVSKKDDKTYYSGTYYDSICASYTVDSEGNKSYTYVDSSLCSEDNTTEDIESNEEETSEKKLYETINNVCITSSDNLVVSNVSSDHCVASGDVYEGTYYSSICSSYTDDETNKIFVDDGTSDNSFCKATFTKAYVSSDGKSIELTIKNTLNNVTISKQDINGAEIEGATLKICSETDYKTSGNNCKAATTINNEEMSWISENYSTTWYGISVGTYYLIETTPPAGYISKTTAVKFTVNDDGTVTSSSLDEETNTIVITNDLNFFEISKADLATSEELPGASLAICAANKDENGEYVISLGDGEEECDPVTLASGDVATWISGEQPHKISGLAPGAYYLIEKIVPDGYDAAESILFIMNEDGTLASKDGQLLSEKKITMYDSKIPSPAPTGEVLTTILCILGLFFIGYVIYIINKKNIEV